jgi:hypothetical protein
VPFKQGSVIMASLLFSVTLGGGWAQTNLITNGSFEAPVVPYGNYILVSTGQDLIPGWSVVGAAGNVAPISGVFSQYGFIFPAQDGAQWLDLTGASNTATGVEQTVSTTAGVTYELSFWVGNVAGSIFGSTSTVNVFVDGTPILVAKNAGVTTTQEWQQFKASFTATGSTATIRLINGDPSSDNHNGLDNVAVMEAWVFADFLGYGLYSWNGTACTHLSSYTPQVMVAAGSMLWGDFGPLGLYQWDGNAWALLSSYSPESMVAAGTMLYADFGVLGLYQWDGNAWALLSSYSPESMVVSGSTLYVDFGTLGLYKWDGGSWAKLTANNPLNMVVSGSRLYGDFGALGLYQWDGNAWALLSSYSPDDMVAAGTMLYADFGALGLHKWNGSGWAQLSGYSPENMQATGSMLYVDFGALGFYMWNGSGWAQLSSHNPGDLISN